jgi:hypothetical protein
MEVLGETMTPSCRGQSTMTDSIEPLRENETGAYGKLAARPNPDQLVIMPIPPVEDLLPFLEQRLGRKLSAEEIEIERRKAPSIVVTKTAAEKIQAERAKRAATRQPAKTKPSEAPKAPTVKESYSELPSAPVDRKEAAVDVFGQHLFSLRNQVLAWQRRVVESPDARESIGTLQRKEYDAIAAFSPEMREAALGFARKAIDGYLQQVLVLFTGIGDDLRFGEAHAVNYRLVLEVKDIKSDEVVEEFVVNRECKKVFYEYYGRWLNRHGDHR